MENFWSTRRPERAAEGASIRVIRVVLIVYPCRPAATLVVRSQYRFVGMAKAEEVQRVCVGNLV